MPRTAAIYCRISQDRNGEGLGVARQRADCEALAKRRGWAIGGLYIDNDVSAYSGKPRPEYNRMLVDVKNGAVNAIVIWHPDRLHRSPKELEAFIDLMEAHEVQIATCTAGDIDLSNSDGRLLARITGSVARKESEDKSRRTCRKHEELAVNGKPSGGGCRPFGYDDDQVTLVPHEADAIRDAARRILAGDTVRSIVYDWRHDGLATVKGSEWTTTTVRGLLKSARISGQREHQGKIVGPAVWPAIITPDETARLRAIFADRSRNTIGGKRARSYLLSGFLICGACGAKLVTRPSRNSRRYICSSDRGGCNGLGISAEHLDEAVADLVIEMLNSPGLAERLADDGGSDDSAMLGAVQAIEDRLEQLARDHYADEIIGRDEYLAARAGLQVRLNEARRKLAVRRPPDVLAGLPAGPGLAEAWPSLTLDRRRSILAMMIESITVAPTTKRVNRFDPDRIEPPNGRIVWRV